MRNLPTSDADKFSGGYANKVGYHENFSLDACSRHNSQLSTSSAALDLAPLSQTPPRTSFVGRALDSRDKSSEWPLFNGSARGPDAFAARDQRRNVTNPAMTLSPALGDIANGKVIGTVSGSATPLLQQVSQGLSQGLSSRRGSPLDIVNGLSIQTARSVPATPLPGMPNSGSHMAKAPGTPLGTDSQTLNGILNAQASRALEDNELNPSLSRMPSAQFDGSPLTFSSIQSNIDDQQYGSDYGLDSARYSPYGFENNGRSGSVNSGTGSTALYHHHGSRYGLGAVNGGGRPNGVDGKMNGLHGPKHKRGDIDRECKFTDWLRIVRIS